jgi:hypothetical protein
LLDRGPGIAYAQSTSTPDAMPRSPPTRNRCRRSSSSHRRGTRRSLGEPIGSISRPVSDGAFHLIPTTTTPEPILFEWNITENWLVGGAVFDNSFGQNSQYVYGGYRFRPFETLQQLYFKISAGIVHGYSGEFQDKIPFNNSGFAPVIVPSMGYCINRFCSELVIFGGAGAMLTFGVTLP